MSSCVAFLTKDLMFQSRVSSAAKSMSLALVADRSVERLVARLAEPATVRLWVIDLSLELDDLTAARHAIAEASPEAACIAYGPHVHADRLEQASVAGFDQVLTRGQFDHQMMTILGSLISDAQ
jgi:hypothetical protein